MNILSCFSSEPAVFSRLMVKILHTWNKSPCVSPEVFLIKSALSGETME
jgi:hypothetical protein